VASLEVHGRSEGCSIDTAFRTFMCPPFFPVGPDDLAGDITFHDLVDAELTWGRARITAADVPHTGPTNGYRVEIDGLVVVYISDHQQPADPNQIAPSVLELCRDADLVIHDAQFEAHEFAVKADWGHCTVEYAVRVAAEAGAKRLALFHHDPAHGPTTSIDRLWATPEAAAVGTSVTEVIAASEGLTVSLNLAAASA
jgi:ribonuclease BN (tRNA processing enzyme)